MDIDKIKQIKSAYDKVKTMDVLWGAWVKQTTYDEQSRTYSFEGIYDTIYKDKKADYPFYIDLLVILACQASPAEYDRTFTATLDLIDDDAINHLAIQDEQITVPSGDSPQRWYEDFELKGVEIREPGQYSLSILIENQQKHAVPLWVVSSKMLITDEENDVTTELWAEDYKRLKGNIQFCLTNNFDNYNIKSTSWGLWDSNPSRPF